MISATIDIGTNTVLLLVADVSNGTVNALAEKQRITRLGRGVEKEKNLHPDSITRVLNVLTDYKLFLESEYHDAAENTVVTATSAVRDASNRGEFIEEVRKRTSWEVQLLSGVEEARTTYKGALSVLKERDKQVNLILDIGGGSTELAFGHGYELASAVSIDMGSVRFTERFFQTDPPSDSDIERAVKEIRDLLRQEKKPEPDFDLIGVAGTVTAIAGIVLDLDLYITEKLNGYRLKMSAVERYIEEFSTHSSAIIETTYPEFLKGRGEVILAGILILREVLDWSGKEEIIVSTGGIRHGILLK